MNLPSGATLRWAESPAQQARAWECALRLCWYLDVEWGRERLQGLRVLELGCGLGLPGLVSAKHGAASVLLTDIPSGIEPAQKAVDDNGLGWTVKVQVRVSVHTVGRALFSYHRSSPCLLYGPLPLPLPLPCGPRRPADFLAMPAQTPGPSRCSGEEVRARLRRLEVPSISFSAPTLFMATRLRPGNSSRHSQAR